jgi:chromate transport protein ChrA
VPGAVAATAAVFTVPVVLAGFTAQLVAKLKDAHWFQAFGRFSAVAAVGLLGVTLLAIARPVVDIHWALLLGSAVVFVAELRGAHPIILIAAAALLGAAWPLIDDALVAL